VGGPASSKEAAARAQARAKYFS